MKLFVDTGALIALAMTRDRHHEAAVRFLKASSRARLVLTDLVLSEVATRLRARAGPAVGVEVARDLLASRRYEIIFANRELFEAALVKMERFADKALSLTDCVSFVTMDQLGLDTAFAFDRDFRDCGYRMLP